MKNLVLQILNYQNIYLTLVRIVKKRFQYYKID